MQQHQQHQPYYQPYHLQAHAMQQHAAKRAAHRSPRASFFSTRGSFSSERDSSAASLDLRRMPRAAASPLASDVSLCTRSGSGSRESDASPPGSPPPPVQQMRQHGSVRVKKAEQPHWVRARRSAARATSDLTDALAAVARLGGRADERRDRDSKASMNLASKETKRSEAKSPTVLVSGESRAFLLEDEEAFTQDGSVNAGGAKVPGKDNGVFTVVVTDSETESSGLDDFSIEYVDDDEEEEELAGVPNEHPQRGSGAAPPSLSRRWNSAMRVVSMKRDDSRSEATMRGSIVHVAPPTLAERLRLRSTSSSMLRPVDADDDRPREKNQSHSHRHLKLDSKMPPVTQVRAHTNLEAEARSTAPQPSPYPRNSWGARTPHPGNLHAYAQKDMDSVQETSTYAHGDDYVGFIGKSNIHFREPARSGPRAWLRRFRKKS